MEEPGKLFTTAEIMLATGLGRGTITNRARKLGFERNGVGYTSVQVLKIVTQPLEIHRKSEENAMELRENLNQMFEENGLPMAIVRKKNGQANIEFRATAK